MEIKVYTIGVNPPRWVRNLIVYVALPVGVLVGAAVVVRALGPLNSFVAGDKISAQAVNDNFNALNDAVTQLQSAMAILDDQQRITRALVGSDGTIKYSSGSWISLVSHTPGSGGWVLTFADGIFSATPICVATANSGNQVAPTIECYNVSKAGASCAATSASKGTGSVSDPLDTPFFFLCAGPR
jgi:hypothetical protein